MTYTDTDSMDEKIRGDFWSEALSQMMIIFDVKVDDEMKFQVYNLVHDQINPLLVKINRHTLSKLTGKGTNEIH